MGVVRFEVMKAREAVRSAEQALRQIVDVAETDLGLAMSTAVQRRVRHAVRRVVAARAALHKVDPQPAGRNAGRIDYRVSREEGSTRPL